MKRLGVYFLAFVTFWISTWMVTDIHDWSIADNNQPHPVFSVQQADTAVDRQMTTQDHHPNCGVCSYDHGGHMGQTLAALSFVAVILPVQNTIKSPLFSDFWYTRTTPPKLRPPIA